MDIDRTQSSSEPVRLTCFAFQNATVEKTQNQAIFSKVNAGTRSRTLLLDEDFCWEVLVPYFTLVDLCRRRLEQSLRFF